MWDVTPSWLCIWGRCFPPVTPPDNTSLTVSTDVKAALNFFRRFMVCGADISTWALVQRCYAWHDMQRVKTNEKYLKCHCWGIQKCILITPKSFLLFQNHNLERYDNEDVRSVYSRHLGDLKFYFTDPVKLKSENLLLLCLFHPIQVKSVCGTLKGASYPISSLTRSST